MITVSVDTSAFNRAIQEFAKKTGVSLREATRSRAAAVVASCMSITPPGKTLKPADSKDGKGKSTVEGGRKLDTSDKKFQEVNIELGIRAIFVTTSAPEEKVRKWIADKFFPPRLKAKKDARFSTPTSTAFSASTMYRHHQANRNPRTGRTAMTRGTAYTRRGVIKEFIKTKKKNAGYLANGWVPSAEGVKLGKRWIPSWIGRHRGGYRPKIAHIGAHITEITVGNNRFIAENVRRKMQFAIHYQTRMTYVQAAKMMKRLEDEANKRS